MPVSSRPEEFHLRAPGTVHDALALRTPIALAAPDQVLSSVSARGGVHAQDLPDLAVGVLDGAIEHDAKILHRVGIAAAAGGLGPFRRRLHRLAAVDECQQRLLDVYVRQVYGPSTPIPLVLIGSTAPGSNVEPSPRIRASACQP
jgi:hypothetical protein